MSAFKLVEIYFSYLNPAACQFTASFLPREVMTSGAIKKTRPEFAYIFNNLDEETEIVCFHSPTSGVSQKKQKHLHQSALWLTVFKHAAHIQQIKQKEKQYIIGITGWLPYVFVD